MRLDSFIFAKGYFKSRNKATECCKRGEVFVNGKAVLKPSYEVVGNEKIEIKQRVSYVSLGAYKLEKALNDFNYDAGNKVFADIGASTGGFTHCLLMQGAKKIYAVDVGENLLDKSLSLNEKVVVMNNTNARFLTKESFFDRLDGIVVDCSFISLKLLLPTLADLIDDNASIIALIKPQFECGKNVLGKSGILFREKDQLDVVLSINEFCKSQNLTITNFTYSPLNAKKNIEYLILIEKNGKNLTSKFFADIIAKANRDVKEKRAGK